MNQTEIIYIVCSILAFIPAIVLHEVSHGFVAYKLGDPTAKSAGRLTLNPLKHIDPFGTVILPLLLMAANMPIFGYAKPVPYNPQYFEDRRKGDFYVGLAGPAANLLMAIIGALIAWALYPYAESLTYYAGHYDLFWYFYVYFLPYFTLINLYLMFFNLLPIPPLDGSSIFARVLPEKYLNSYYKIQSYAMPVFMIVLIVLPQVIGFDPFSWYLNVTAGNLANLMYPFAIAG
ncbi:MAG: site-2 protease family protein [Eggerthellaceae bacterium]|jgi:Zn-dependent protease